MPTGRSAEVRGPVPPVATEDLTRVLPTHTAGPRTAKSPTGRGWAQTAQHRGDGPRPGFQTHSPSLAVTCAWPLWVSAPSPVQCPWHLAPRRVVTRSREPPGRRAGRTRATVTCRSAGRRLAGSGSPHRLSGGRPPGTPSRRRWSPGPPRWAAPTTPRRPGSAGSCNRPGAECDSGVRTGRCGTEPRLEPSPCGWWALGGSDNWEAGTRSTSHGTVHQPRHRPPRLSLQVLLHGLPAPSRWASTALLSAPAGPLLRCLTPLHAPETPTHASRPSRVSLPS